MSLKPQNYFQVVLRGNVKNRYLEIFFKSKMGSLALSSLIKGAVIGYRTKDDLKVTKIPIPELKIQELIITASDKIELLRNSINSFEKELSMNPNNANLIQNELDDILTILGKLSKEEEIIAMIRSGESKTLEFKQTFTKDIDTNIKEKEKKIRTASLKNIVAFLNTDGGTLLIGVKDNGIITGIEVDYYKNDDKYRLNFKNQVKERIGEDCYPFLNWEINKVKNKKILRVDCKPANTPFFLDEKEFFVRTNPSADKLEGRKLNQYLKTRFPDK
jgi:restriction endonuclease S subunit